MNNLYAGSICGTSLDGIDVALVELDDQRARVLHYNSVALDATLATAMRAIVFDGKTCDALTFGQLDQQFGIAIANAILALLAQHGVAPNKVTAIGSHGINLLHAPDADVPVTLQIGDPNQIARLTGITTVADFRRRDVALGGQGAPLAPAFHAAMFAHERDTRVVLNLGGIANITVLQPGQDVIGFDTGPANGLMDAWFVEHGRHATGTNEDFDRNGAWAAGASVDQRLLDALLADPYFSRAAPKSTGKEHFNLAWLQRALADVYHVEGPIDALLNPGLNFRSIQTTLAELTVRTVCDSLSNYAPNTAQLLLCGGGAHNAFLRQRFIECLPNTEVITTSACGVAPDHVEAAAFAWLAKRTLARESGNVSSVTGASENAILGGIYYA